jgi:hypothetical protein
MSGYLNFYSIFIGLVEISKLVDSIKGAGGFLINYNLHISVLKFDLKIKCAQTRLEDSDNAMFKTWRSIVQIPVCS